MSLRFLSDEMRSLIGEDDTFGQIGTPWFQDRSSLFLDVTATSSDGHCQRVEGDIIIPQGATLKQMQDGCFPTNPDRSMGVSTTVDNVCFPQKEIPTGKVLLKNVQERCPKASHQSEWIFDHQSLIFPRSNRKPGPLRVLELFCGGCGGWTAATKFLSKIYKQDVQTVGVDHSITAIANYAGNHGSHVLNALDGIPTNILQSGKNFAILADIDDQSWWEEVARWGPDIVTISAPCVSWSGASTAAGLSNFAGMLFPSAVAHCRRFRPKLVTAENVPGFAGHPDCPVVMKQLQGGGLPNNGRVLLNRLSMGELSDQDGCALL